MSSICFLFPEPGNQPCGGLKVIYEYANRLVNDGHEVHIAYAGSIFWAQKSLYYKLTGIVRYGQKVLNGFSGRHWFPLNQKVKEHLAFSLNYRHVPQADIYIGTNPYTAMYLKDYPVENNRKFYFIQDYENWGDVTDAKLRETYHFPLRKIVISHWLERIMTEENESCTVVPNGFDFSRFQLKTPIEQKERYSVVMLYHLMERKDCKTGFQALALVKEKFSQLKVRLFGVPARPENLPEWYEYHQTPSPAMLNQLYDRSAIFLGTSKTEGWGLCIGEAMLCGCTVVCTDNPGYLEMAENGKNALVSPVRDASKLAENIMRLFNEDALRIRLAGNGHQDIQKFSWENAYKKFKNALAL